MALNVTKPNINDQAKSHKNIDLRNPLVVTD